MTNIKTLRDLYRVDNKYWKTGDTDYLSARTKFAMEIDERFWSEVQGIVSVATRKHLPIKSVIAALKPLGILFSDEDVESDG